MIALAAATSLDLLRRARAGALDLAAGLAGVAAVLGMAAALGAPRLRWR